MRSGDSSSATCAAAGRTGLLLAHMTSSWSRRCWPCTSIVWKPPRRRARRGSPGDDERDASDAAARGEPRSAGAAAAGHARAAASGTAASGGQCEVAHGSFSTARRRALSARGLAATSTSLAVQAPCLSSTHGLHRVADARQAGRARAAAGGGVAEPVLHDAVLARVVREHGAAAAGRDLDRLVDRRTEDLELAVDLDADRLERALGRMATAAAGGRRDGVARRSRRARPWSRSGRAARWPWRCGGRSARRRTSRRTSRQLGFG